MRLKTHARRSYGTAPRTGCAVLAALLLVSPGAAQAPVDPHRTEATLAEEPDAGEGAPEAADPDGSKAAGAEPAADGAKVGDAPEAPPEKPKLDLGELQDSLERSSPSLDIEEIIVTGSKTEGFKEVPISVTQFGASDLQTLRIQDVADLSAYTPNLEINTSFAASNPTLFIRGIGLKDYNANSAGAVAVYQDGIQMNSPVGQLSQFFDTESIEVLRGPLGALFGRNATAGAIFINSYKPDGEFSSTGSFTYGNYNDIEVEGAVGFPIFPTVFKETLSGRLAFTANFRDGYVKNQCADWDPEANGFLKVTEDSLLDFYDQLDATTTPVKVVKSSGRFGLQTEDLLVFQNIDFANELRAGPQPLFGLGNTKELAIDPDGDGSYERSGQFVVEQQGQFSVVPDRVCLISAPGQILTPRGKNEDLLLPLTRADCPPDDPSTPNKNENNCQTQRFSMLEAGDYNALGRPLVLEDLQGLQHRYNNVKNWAIRGMLRWQPTDELDFLFNAHWSQNRGDSFHAQTVGVTPRSKNPAVDLDDRGFIINPLGYNQANNGTLVWDEREAPHQFGFEGVAPREGLSGPSGSPPFPLSQGVGGSDVYSGFYNRDGLEILDTLGFSLTATQELEAGRFVSISGYEENSRLIEDEGDACPCKLTEADYGDSTWQATQELRLEGEGDRYDWTVGGFYIHEVLESSNKFVGTLSFLFDQGFTQTTDGWNLVARGRYDFLEEGIYPGFYQVSVDAGIRYNWEHKRFSLSSTGQPLQDGVPLGAVEVLPEQVATGLWDDVTGEITLSWKPIEDLKLYGKYTRGLKAGHFNAGLLVNSNVGGVGGPTAEQSISPVAPEYINAVEVGVKSTWFDDQLQLNASLFRYWYTDLQVFDIVNEASTLPTQQLLNSDADVLGAEVELQLVPIEGMLIQAGFGWLDTAYRDFIVTKRTSVGGKGGTGNFDTFDYSGNPLIAAPKYSVSGIVEYEIPLSHWGSLVPQYDFSWKDRVFLDPQAELLIGQRDYWLHNARLAYRTPDGRIEVAGWVQNFLDQRYKIEAFDQSRESRLVQEIWAEPRTYGFTVSYLW